jgi:hypothetical protein
MRHRFATGMLDPKSYEAMGGTQSTGVHSEDLFFLTGAALVPGASIELARRSA